MESKILDVGCGYTRTLNELYQLEYKDLIGLDFSTSIIERGKNNFPHLDLMPMDVEIIPLEDSSVDAIILFAVLTCIVKNDEQKKLIDEILRVLKPGGILYFNDFLINGDERNIARYYKYLSKYDNYGVFELPEGAVLRHHNIEWIKELLLDFNEASFPRNQLCNHELE